MDIREILVANTKTQKRYKINTDATTLSELKAALDAEGIDYADMSFTEGISKTQLTSDDSQLPTNVMYKGAPTNNLVILLTNTTKNISSGTLTRKELYALIRENNLSEDLKAAFGNWTIISTEVLEEYIHNNYDLLDEDRDEEPQNDEEEEDWDNVEADNPALVDCIYDSIKLMYDNDVLTSDDVIVLADLLTDFSRRMREEEVGCGCEPAVAPRHPAEVTDEEANSKIDDILEGL